MISTSAVPTLNAALNGLSALFFVTGYLLIRQSKIVAHRACMLAAFGTSTLFLTSYLIFHAQVGSMPFAGQGIMRPLYYTLLVSHIVPAATVVPMALIVLYRGLKRRYFKHRRLARWVFPVWMYVSITGVVIYVMLCHLYPASPAIAGGTP